MLCFLLQEFQAAKEQSSGGKAGGLGMFHTLDDPPEIELPSLPDAASMTLTPPWASREVKHDHSCSLPG